MATIAAPPPVRNLSSVAQTPPVYAAPSAAGTCKCNVQMEYPSHELARIVMTALSVDSELQPDKVSREIRVEGSTLLVSFVAVEARVLRSAFTAFMDMLVLATNTIEEFSQLPLVSPAVKYAK